MSSVPQWINDRSNSTNWIDNKDVITIGTMFSGIESYIHALKAITSAYRHCFSIENNAYCCKVIRKTAEPELMIQQDVNKINIDLLPHVDVFCASPSCTPYSTLGVQNPADPRRDLIQPVIDYVTKRKPYVVVVENVVNFKTSPACARLKNELEENEYTVEMKILDSSDFGSPQKRKRLFVLAVARHCQLPWPVPTFPLPKPINSVVLEPISNLPAHVWLTEKGVAYVEKRKKWGSRVFKRDYVGTMPTFCKSYGHQTHWKHTIHEDNGKLRKLTCREIANLMGFDATFPVDIVSKTQTQYQLGNAIDLHVLRPLMKELFKLLCKAKQDDRVVIRREDRTFTFRQ